MEWSDIDQFSAYQIFLKQFAYNAGGWGFIGASDWSRRRGEISWAKHIDGVQDLNVIDFDATIWALSRVEVKCLLLASL